MKNKVIRLGLVGVLAGLSLVSIAVPVHAETCGPVIDSIKICTSPSGHSHPVVADNPAPPAVVISGALMIGNTVTVIDTGWPLDAKLTHQWLRNELPVLGAVGSSYRLTAKDLGKGIQVTTTATAPGRPTTTVKSAKTAPISNAGGAIPTVSTPSRLQAAGSSWPGQVMTAQINAWAWRDKGVSFNFQWHRDGMPLPGMTGTTYDLTEDDLGRLIKVSVVAYKAGFDPVTLTSAERLITAGPYPGALITGGTGLGQVLRATDDRPWESLWSEGNPDAYPEHSYQWLRDGNQIAGATALRYTITTEDQGKTLVLQTRTSQGSVYSRRVVIPAAASQKKLTNFTKPVLTGDSMTGKPMTVTAGTWSAPAEKLALTYAWYVGEWAEGDGQLYTPTTEQAGKTVRVVVKATAPGYSTSWVTVAAPKPVTKPEPTQTSAPTIRGNLVIGGSVSVGGPEWSDSQDPGGTAVGTSFQWLREGTPIAGATESWYSVVGADVGKKLSVTVTSTLAGKVLKTQTLVAPGKAPAAALRSSKPIVNGTAKIGTVLTARPGIWTKDAVLNYRWLRNGSIIPNAVAATYKVRTADRGAKITVRVTGTLTGYTTVSQESLGFFAR